TESQLQVALKLCAPRPIVSGVLRQAARSDRGAILERITHGYSGQPPHAPAPRRRRWSAWLKPLLALLAVLAATFVVGMALLFYADFTTAANGSSDPRTRAAWALDHGDHLHFAGHIVLGRVLDPCPCSRRPAAARYFYAKFHAVTARQKSVATTTEPHNLREWATYLGGPFGVAFDWLGDGIGWLSGDRPSRSIAVNLDQYEIVPSELHIAR